MSDTADAVDAARPDTGNQQQANTDTSDSDEPDWKAEAERWRVIADQVDKRAKRLDDQAKANAKAARELEDIRKSSMSDLEKAVAEARAEAERGAAVKYGGRVVDAELRGELRARRLDDKQIDAHLQYLDRTRFLTEDGEPDAKAIAAWVEAVTPPPTKPGMPYGSDLGQGARPPAEPTNASQAMNTLLRKGR